jgi:hypothetical protein
VQALAEAIVVDDEELDQHRLPGVTDGVENRIEGGLAINQ